MNFFGWIVAALASVTLIAMAAWFCYAVGKVNEEMELFAGFDGMHFDDWTDRRAEGR
jgi:hypothetical protein